MFGEVQVQNSWSGRPCRSFRLDLEDLSAVTAFPDENAGTRVTTVRDVLIARCHLRSLRLGPDQYVFTPL